MLLAASMTKQSAKTLYNPEFERDSCGFGLIANLDDIPSHWVVETSIAALARLTHRGAVAADGKTGDGCGLLIKFPAGFLRAVGEEAGFTLNQRFAAGPVFLSQDESVAIAARKVINHALEETGLVVAGWREVPLDPGACGDRALATMPRIEQVFVNAPDGMPRGRFTLIPASSPISCGPSRPTASRSARPPPPTPPVPSTSGSPSGPRPGR